MTFTIYRTIQSPYISQRFEDNLACAKGEGGILAYPIVVLSGTYPNACPPGSIKFYPALGMNSHGAIDRPCWYKEPGYFDVLDTECGWDQYIEVDSAGGIGVDAVSQLPIKPCTEGCVAGTKHHVKRRYWHAAAVVVNGEVWDMARCIRELQGHERVRVCTNIKAGQLIYYGDSTGASSGNHVHDATKWCDNDGDGIHTSNGYYGNFDDRQYRREVFILDEIALRAEEDAAVAESIGDTQEAQAIRAQIVTLQLSLIDVLKKLIFELSQQLLKGRNAIASLWDQNHSA